MLRYFVTVIVLFVALTVLGSCRQAGVDESVAAPRVRPPARETEFDTPKVGESTVAEPAEVNVSTPAEKKPAAEDIVDHPSKLKFPPLEFEPPKAADYRVELENGMIIYIVEDKELPTFDMEVTVRTGSMYEPVDKVGLAAMCGALLTKGGTTSMTGEEIDEYMAQLAGSLGARIGFASGSVSLSVLKEDTDKGLKMLADVIMNPVFAEDEIRRYKERTLQGLEHRYDRPRSILGDVCGKLMYGNHPAGRTPSASSIRSIRREDLLGFHEDYFHPNNCIVAVAGDFNREEMVGKIKELFADWDVAGIEFPEVPDVEQESAGGVFLVEKDINQGYVRIGHIGIRDDNPDVYAVRVMNAILGGGGFTSRITGRVRSDEGLAYSVGSWFDIPVEYTGTFACSFQTKSGSVAYAVSIVIEEINRIRTELASEEELQQAKDLFIERFPSIFTGRGSAAYARVQALAGNEYNRRPLDYYEHYRDNYGKVTREQVREAAVKYLKPEGLKVVVVGKIKDMKAGDGLHACKLEDFGSIKEMELPDVMK